LLRPRRNVQAAALPMSVMKLRRLMSDMKAPQTSVPISLPQTGLRVLGQA